MNTYRATIRALGPYAQLGLAARPSDVASLAAALDGLRPMITQLRDGTLSLTVTVDREDHAAVANELFEAAQRYGYTLLNGEISKLVSRAAAGAVIGSTGSFVGGALVAPDKPCAFLAASILGGALGTAIGSQIKRFEPLYEVKPRGLHSWELVRVPGAGDLTAAAA